MNLLPIAAPAAPAGGASTDTQSIATSGDFAALVAMLVATASTTLPTQRPPARPESAPPDTAAGDAAPLLPAPPVAAPVVTAPAPASADSGGAEFAALQPHASTVADGPSAEVPSPPPPPASAAFPVSDEASRTEEPVRLAPSSPRTTTEARPPVELPVELPQHRPAKVSKDQPLPDQPLPDQPLPDQRLRGRSVRESGPSRSAAEPLLAALEPRTVVDDSTPVPPDVPPRAEPDRAAPAPSPSPQAQVAAVPVDRQERRVNLSLPEKAEGLPAPKITATVSHSAGSPNPMVPLLAVNRSEALSPVDAPPAAPVAAPVVPEQIVSAVVPLHGRGDGRHEVTLELRPDHLGTIRVEVTVEHQTVHLTLHAAEPATSRLLNASLPELRTALADAGLTPGQVGVGPDGGGSAGQWRNPSAAGEPQSGRLSAGNRGAPPSDDPEPVRPARPAVAGRLDLFL